MQKKISQFDQRVLRQLHNQSCALERHEEKIASHTRIQSWIALAQLIFGIVTTCLLIYIAVLQVKAADRQVLISDRQVILEYAKVAPQFDVKLSTFSFNGSPSSPSSFPSEISIRILRGEGAIVSVKLYQDIRVSLLKNDGNGQYTCVLRVGNYWKRKPGNVTDFYADGVARVMASDPSTFIGRNRDFLIADVDNALLEIEYRDIFGAARKAKFSGKNGAMSQIPSGNFSKNPLWETVPASFSERARFDWPNMARSEWKNFKTSGCRQLFTYKKV